jgi:hypothetical protein
LKELGGSGTNEEINEKVSKIDNISEEVLSIPHNERQVDYRIGYTKTYQKQLFEHSPPQQSPLSFSPPGHKLAKI